MICNYFSVANGIFVFDNHIYSRNGSQMGQADKIKEAFRSCSGTFSYREFLKLLSLLGYEPLKVGHSGGSRRKFQNPATGRQIWFHEPHGDEMKKKFVAAMREWLEEDGAL